MSRANGLNWQALQTTIWLRVIAALNAKSGLKTLSGQHARLDYHICPRPYLHSASTSDWPLFRLAVTRQQAIYTRECRCLAPLIQHKLSEPYHKRTDSTFKARRRQIARKPHMCSSRFYTASLEFLPFVNWILVIGVDSSIVECTGTLGQDNDATSCQHTQCIRATRLWKSRDLYTRGTAWYRKWAYDDEHVCQTLTQCKLIKWSRSSCCLHDSDCLVAFKTEARLWDTIVCLGR